VLISYILLPLEILILKLVVALETLPSVVGVTWQKTGNGSSRHRNNKIRLMVLILVIDG